MNNNENNFPVVKKTLEQEVYALRLEVYYFKKEFQENYKTAGCVRLKLQKLWIYFLSLSNVAIWTFLFYLVKYIL
jgi:hypothetical protein